MPSSNHRVLAHIIVAPLYTWYAAKVEVNPWIGFTALYLHLGWIQYSTVSMGTATFMMMVMRMVTYLWHVSDDARAETASLFELYEYAFAIGGFFSGPIMPYPEYIKWTSEDKTPDATFVPRVTRLIKECLAFVGLFYLTVDWSYGAAIVSHETFAAQPLWVKLAKLPFAALHGRLKYYVVWNVSEITCLYLCWPARQSMNVDVAAIESAESVYAVIDRWNISTARYLKSHVYLKLKSATGKRATFLTFVLSAYWHGFYGGYYLSFVNGAIMVLIGRRLRALLRPRVKTDGFSVAYNVAGWLLTHASVAYMMAPFVIMEWAGSMWFYRELYFIGHFVALTLFVGCYCAGR